MVIMIGEQQTKQSSVYFCSLIEASITIVINSPQFGQKIPRKCTQISSWCDAPTRLAYAIIHGSPETVRFEAAPDAEEFHVQIDEHRWLISADWKARKANIQTTFGRPQTANRVLSPVVRSGRRAQHPK